MHALASNGPFAYAIMVISGQLASIGLQEYNRLLHETITWACILAVCEIPAVRIACMDVAELDY